jgi:hypothetical protein
VILLALALALALPALAASLAGRPVVDVLAGLERDGLRLIYSSDLVSPQLRVLREPAAAGGVELAREVLAPHGLTVRAVGRSSWAVVPLPATASPPPPAPPAINEVVVTASLYSLAENRVDAHTFLTAEEVAALPKLADEPLRAVHRLPGAASNGVSGLAYMRGGEENETQVVLDGLVLAEPFHMRNFFTPVSVLNASIIGSLDVYTGAWPVQWGERMSAIIDVRSVEVPAEGSYQLGLSLFHTDGLAADSFADGRVRWLVAGRRSNLDEVADLADSKLGEPRYADLFGRLEVDVTDRLRWSLRTLYSADEVRLNDDPVTEKADADYRTAAVWTALDYDWSDRLHGRALLSLTDVSNDREGTVTETPLRSGFVDDERDYRIATLRLELGWDDGERSLRGGVDAGTATASYRYRGVMDFAADYPFPGQPDRGFDRDYALDPEGHQVAAWLSARQRFGERLTAEAGLRWSDQGYDDVGGRTQLGPRLNLLYTLSPLTRLRLGWGRVFQPQSINEVQVEDGVADFFAPQYADHLVAGLEHTFGRSIELRIEAYRKDYDGLRPRYENLFDPFSILPELQADRIRVAPEGGRAQGIELLLRQRGLGPVDWWAGYTFASAEDDIGGDRVSRSWEQRHALNAGIAWQRGPWNLNLAGTWHSGWPTTGVALEDGTGPGVVVGSRNAINYDDFFSVDLRLSYTATLGRGELETFVEFTNVTVHDNPCCTTWTVGTDGGGATTLARDLDYWPRFVPNIGVRWRL